jgi:hypothetical protein
MPHGPAGAGVPRAAWCWGRGRSAGQSVRAGWTVAAGGCWGPPAGCAPAMKPSDMEFIDKPTSTWSPNDGGTKPDCRPRSRGRAMSMENGQRLCLADRVAAAMVDLALAPLPGAAAAAPEPAIPACVRELLDADAASEIAAAYRGAGRKPTLNSYFDTDRYDGAKIAVGYDWAALTEQQWSQTTVCGRVLAITAGGNGGATVRSLAAPSTSVGGWTSARCIRFRAVVDGA